MEATEKSKSSYYSFSYGDRCPSYSPCCSHEKSSCIAYFNKIGLFEAGATCSILFGRPLEGETILSGWSGLAWIACLLPHSGGLECVGPLELLVCWYTRSRFSIKGHIVDPTSCLLPCLCMTPLRCCRLPPVLSGLNRDLGNLLERGRLLIVPDSLCAACFLAETRTLLQCIHLNKCTTLLLRRACFIDCNG